MFIITLEHESSPQTSVTKEAQVATYEPASCRRLTHVCQTTAFPLTPSPLPLPPLFPLETKAVAACKAALSPSSPISTTDKQPVFFLGGNS